MARGLRIRTGILAASMIAGCALLSGCGGDPNAAYCADIEDASAGLTKTFDTGGARTGLLNARPVLGDLAKDAPHDVRDDWRTLLDAIDGLKDAIDDAGLDPEDVDGTLPKDLPADRRTALEAATLRLASPSVTGAAATIEQHARDVCHTPLF